MCLLLLFLIVCYIGYGILSYYKKRAKIYEDLISFINCLNVEISFLKTNLIKIVEKEKTDYCKEFNDILNKFYDKLLSKESSCFECKCELLNDNENKEISDFFNCLGKTDIKQQQMSIEHYKNKFLQHSSRFVQERDKNGVVGLKLSILLGLALCIVLI